MTLPHRNQIAFIKDIPRETEPPDDPSMALDFEDDTSTWPGATASGYKSFNPSLWDKVRLWFYKMDDRISSTIMAFPYRAPGKPTGLGLEVYFDEFSSMGLRVEVPVELGHIRIARLKDVYGVGCYRCGIAKELPERPWLFQSSVTAAVWLFSRKHKDCKGNTKPVKFIPYPRKAYL